MKRFFKKVDDFCNNTALGIIAILIIIFSIWANMAYRKSIIKAAIREVRQEEK